MTFQKVTRPRHRILPAPTSSLAVLSAPPPKANQHPNFSHHSLFLPVSELYIKGIILFISGFLSFNIMFRRGVHVCALSLCFIFIP